MRITSKHLEAKVSIVNAMIGIDAPQWDTVGAIRLSGAYGGWAVHRIVNTSGGVTDLSGGHGPARGVAEFLSGMIAALRIVKDQTNV